MQSTRAGEPFYARVGLGVTLIYFRGNGHFIGYGVTLTSTLGGATYFIEGGGPIRGDVYFLGDARYITYHGYISLFGGKDGIPLLFIVG